MKIDSLFENVTPSSTPDGNNPASAPKFGRDPEVLEDELQETTAGSIASVAAPIGSMQKRQGTGALLKGIKTSAKFPNSKAVKEEEIKEQDIILNPALKQGPKPGFHNRKDHEGDTVKNSLYTIVQAAKDLNDAIENTTQFPEWVSEKIGAIKHMMVVVKDYVKSQQKRGDDNVIDESDIQYVKKDPKSFLDDDFYAFDPKTKVIKDTWSYKSVGRGYSENRARQEGWTVETGLRAKHLGLLQIQKGTNEGGFDIPEIPRAPNPKPTPNKDAAEKSLQEGEVLQFKRPNVTQTEKPAIQKTQPATVTKLPKKPILSKNLLNQLRQVAQIELYLQTEDSPYLPSAMSLGIKSQSDWSKAWKQNQIAAKKLGYDIEFNMEDWGESVNLYSLARDKWYESGKEMKTFRGLPDLVYNLETDSFTVADFIGADDDGWEPKPETFKETTQEKLYKRHQELRKKSNLPDAHYYKELLATYDLPDEERIAKQKEIKQRYKVK